MTSLCGHDLLRDMVMVDVKGTFWPRVALAKAAVSGMDGADASVTRQGDGTVPRADRPSPRGLTLNILAIPPA